MTNSQSRNNRPDPLVSLGEALRFLTIIPQPWLPPARPSHITAAIPFFPVVGAIIGLFLVSIGWIAGQWWNPIACAALTLVVWSSISGGLHLDGLSDTFDAIMSWRSREQKLIIMRDSHIGAMGVLAIVAVLLLKCAFLTNSTSTLWQAILLAPVLGRWAMVYGILRFHSARTEGLGHAVQGQIGWMAFAGISCATVLFAVLVAGTSAVWIAFLVWATVEVLGRWWTRELGGLTGDTYGALCEIAELVVLAALTADTKFG